MALTFNARFGIEPVTITYPAPTGDVVKEVDVVLMASRFYLAYEATKGLLMEDEGKALNAVLVLYEFPELSPAAADAVAHGIIERGIALKKVLTGPSGDDAPGSPDSTASTPAA